jgi:hypothetical protein
MLVRRDLYLQVGGFDEDELGVAWNDTDFCLRLREQGYRVVMNPQAELIHLGSASRGDAKNDREVGVMFDRWKSVIESDPYYNPNWSRLDTEFRPRTRLDEASHFHYTPAGFRIPTHDGQGESVALEPGLDLGEICRNQSAEIGRLGQRLAALERSEQVIRWLASRPLFQRLRRSGSVDRAFHLLRRTSRRRWVRSLLIRVGLIAR